MWGRKPPQGNPDTAFSSLQRRAPGTAFSRPLQSDLSMRGWRPIRWTHRQPIHPPGQVGAPASQVKPVHIRCGWSDCRSALRCKPGVDTGLRYGLILRGRAGRYADPADNLPVPHHRQTTPDDHQPAPDGGVDTIGG